MSGFVCPYCGKEHGGDPDFICSERWRATGQLSKLTIRAPRQMIPADIGLCEPETVWRIPYVYIVSDADPWNFESYRVWWGGSGKMAGWPTPGEVNEAAREVEGKLSRRMKRRKR